MKKYSVFHIPVLSFFSMALYRDVCHNWKGTCLLYLYILLALCWIPFTVKLHLGLSKFVMKEAPKYVSQIPKITVSKGEISVDAPQPYNIIDPATKKVVFIIDTTGQTKDLDDKDVVGLVKKNEVIVRKGKHEKRSYDMRTVDEFYLDSARVTRWLDLFCKFLAVCLYPFAVVMSIFFRTFQALIYACIGMMFASMCSFEVKFLSLLRLSVVAMTPCIIVRTILDAAGIRIPFIGFLFFIIAMVYLFLGVKASSAPVAEEYPKDEKGENAPPALP